MDTDAHDVADAESSASGHLPFAHLNLAVSDLDRSIAFYRRWFGFGAEPVTYPDGTVFLRNGDRFDLALHPSPGGAPPPRTFHFGFRASAPDRVRRLLDDLRAAGVEVTEHHDTSEYVGCKCLDPDGYEIEVYWEPG